MSIEKPLRCGSDNRKAVRQTGNFSASIVLDGRQCVRCLVKDFSSTGALLMVPSILGLPEQFDLQAASGQRRRVEVKWRGAARLGVKFL